MKTPFLLLLLLLLASPGTAQVPQAFEFQGIARDNYGDVLASQSIQIRLGILEASPTGTIVFQEVHPVTTNIFGLFTLQVGHGVPFSGTFGSINWGSGPHYLMVEMDAGAGLVHMGTTQLLSVPYAMVAGTTMDCMNVSFSGDTLYQGNGCFVIIPGISAANGGCADKDGDGYYDQPGCGTPVDCDDEDPATHPDAIESCDDKDNNCNGIVDEDACDGCADGIKNGQETGIDCGGPECPPCNWGSGCIANSDCGPGLICQMGVCVCPTAGTPCDDGDPCTMNDVHDGACNCVGHSLCDDGDPCTQDICDPILGCQHVDICCSDGIMNGQETGVDCGGAVCGPCGYGQGCNSASDCAPGMICHMGICVPDCPAGFGDCDGNGMNGCETDLNNDVDHCGDCFKKCELPNATSSCNGGSCIVLFCDPGFGDCDGDPLNGCETNLLNSVGNCGSCNNVCQFPNATSSCNNGTCILVACAPGYADCDGDATNGCETNLNTSPGNCGSCSNVCDLANASSSCDNGTCTILSCMPGFADCDGLANNGCEVNLMTSTNNCGSCGSVCPSGAICSNGYCICLPPGTPCDDGNPCTFNDTWDGNCTCTGTLAADAPDMTFTDENCDGIDGDIQNSVFVSASGSDSFPGTMAQPKKTINAAITAAVASSRSAILVAAGSYQEGAGVVMQEGIGIYGGYSPVNWTRSLSNTTTIVGAPQGVISNGASNITLQLLTVEGQFAPGPDRSVYGIRLLNVPQYSIQNCTVIGGNAGAGSHGSAGSNGVTGANGANGQIGSCDAQTSPNGGTGGSSMIGSAGGNGGRGGYSTNNGQAGGTGGNAGGPGGGGGSSGNPGGPGQAGQPGGDGIAGLNGQAGTSNISVVSGEFAGTSGASGFTGGSGRGGGGGGGGGGQASPFANDGMGNGGGGGGAGGGAGVAGGGGTFGGGSFGIFLMDSSGSVTDSQILSGSGGAGGNGGAGGTGGTGGSGGTGANFCTGEVGAGGNGGKGGNGGNGGHGGGGAGGPSIGIYRGGSSSVTTTATSFTIGTPGVGGTAPNTGATGLSGNLLP